MKFKCNYQNTSKNVETMLHTPLKRRYVPRNVLTKVNENFAFSSLLSLQGVTAEDIESAYDTLRKSDDKVRQLYELKCSVPLGSIFGPILQNSHFFENI